VALGRSKGKPPGGLAAAHPHAAQLRELAALVTDGIAFARTRGGLGGGGGQGHSAGRGSLRSSVSGDEKILSEKKEKREKKEKQEKRANSKASPKSGGGVDEALVVPAGVETPAEAVAGTAAGGGGRWVHLPS
jgi:hypothetical protein